MKKIKQITGSKSAVKRTGGLLPLALMLAASALLSGCAYIPWEIPSPWRTGGEGKWASSVGQEPQNKQETQDVQAQEGQPKPEDLFRKAVAGVQGRLAELGYEPGPVDGIPGPTTKSAIRHYQKDAGMQADGEISEKLVARLRQPPPPRSEITPPEPPREADPEIARKPDPDPETVEETDPETVEETDPDTLVIGYLRSDIKPDYAPGDTYAWSDGDIERVLRTRGDTIWWSRSDGAQYSTQRSFVLPMLQWKTPAGSGRTAVGMDSAGAWPTDEETALSFTVHESNSDNNAAAQDWMCRRTGRGKTAVPAGTFGTVTITCERTGAAPDTWRKRVWYYAPAVRHYVRRDDFIGVSGEQRRIDLIAVRLGANDWPPAARGGLDQVIQKSLENKALGEQTRWKSTAVEDRFVIQPTGKSIRYGWDRCRTYIVERMTPDSPRAWPGLACRDASSGRWIIPVLEEHDGSLAGTPVN